MMRRSDFHAVIHPGARPGQASARGQTVTVTDTVAYPVTDQRLCNPLKYNGLLRMLWM